MNRYKSYTLKWKALLIRTLNSISRTTYELVEPKQIQTTKQLRGPTSAFSYHCVLSSKMAKYLVYEALSWTFRLTRSCKCWYSFSILELNCIILSAKSPEYSRLAKLIANFRADAPLLKHCSIRSAANLTRS